MPATTFANACAVGPLLREWRQRRRLSQLALALDAEISTRHLSCLETGKAQPSREMLLRLAEQLAVPLRERNTLLTAAGYAPIYPERPLASAPMQGAHEAVQALLHAHEPFPALAVDRHWNLLACNSVAALLMQGVAPALAQPPVNVLRLSLHPQGLAPRIANLGAWRTHLLARLRQQIAASGDAGLVALLEELRGYPAPEDDAHEALPADAVAVPLQFVTPLGTLHLLSTITVFGTPVDVTLSELALETFFPADAASAALLRQLAPAAAGHA